MVILRIDPEVERTARAYLTERPEQLGFFLAEYDETSRTFTAREWRTIPPEGFESRSDNHLVLSDEARVEVIQWAWQSGRSLVEAHSHGAWGRARFSASDIYGFAEWVPHLWWRLGGRPYAALVYAGDTVDAVAWVEDATTAETVERVERPGDEPLITTGATLS